MSFLRIKNSLVLLICFVVLPVIGMTDAGCKKVLEDSMMRSNWLLAGREVFTVDLGSEVRSSAQAIEFFAKLEKRASVGLARDVYALAKAYLIGVGVHHWGSNAEKAFPLMQKAAENDVYTAWYYLGEMCFFGEGVPIDRKKAFSFYSKAAAEDVRAAYFMLFLMYLTGTGVEVDLKHAFSYGEKALVVEKDSKTLRLFLGGLYAGLFILGSTEIVDFSLASGICTFKIDLPSLNGSIQKLMVSSAAFKNYPVDMERGLVLLGEAAAMRSVEASFALSHLYVRQKDYAKAMYWLKYAAGLGSTEALYQLGKAYKEGLLVEKNTQSALGYFLQLAAKQDVRAELQLLEMVADGLIKEEDFCSLQEWYKNNKERAYKWREDKARKYFEVGELAFLMGSLCRRGKKYEAMVSHFTLAADYRHAEARYLLALAYLSGIGVAEDYKKAFEWALKAAQQGHKQAQEFVAKFYEWGIGVEQDLDKADFWAKKSRDGKPQVQQP